MRAIRSISSNIERAWSLTNLAWCQHSANLVPTWCHGQTDLVPRRDQVGTKSVPCRQRIGGRAEQRAKNVRHAHASFSCCSTDFPCSVVRYCWLELRGLSGMVISIQPAFNRGSK